MLFKKNKALASSNLLDLLRISNDTKLPYERLEFKRNQVIIEENRSNDMLYVLIEGVAAAYQSTSKEDSILYFCGKNELIGFLQPEIDNQTLFGFRAISDVTVYKFDHSYLLERINATSEPVRLIQQLYIASTEALLWREQLLHLPTDKRLLAALLAIGEKFGRTEPDGSYLIPYYFTQKILGSYLHIARTYVAINLQKLEKEGILTLSPKPWQIYKPEEQQLLLNEYFA